MKRVDDTCPKCSGTLSLGRCTNPEDCDFQYWTDEEIKELNKDQ